LLLCGCPLTAQAQLEKNMQIGLVDEAEDAFLSRGQRQPVTRSAAFAILRRSKMATGCDS